MVVATKNSIHVVFGPLLAPISIFLKSATDKKQIDADADINGDAEADEDAHADADTNADVDAEANSCVMR